MHCRDDTTTKPRSHQIWARHSARWSMSRTPGNPWQESSGLSAVNDQNWSLARSQNTNKIPRRPVALQPSISVEPVFLPTHVLKKCAYHCSTCLDECELFVKLLRRFAAFDLEVVMLPMSLSETRAITRLHVGGPYYF